MRLHELARKHGFNQQDLLTAVQKEGFDVKDTLAAVDPAVEKWVVGKAATGWTPPPPDKKNAKKKKVVPVKPTVVLPKPGGETEPVAPAVTPIPAPVTTAKPAPAAATATTPPAPVSVSPPTAGKVATPEAPAPSPATTIAKPAEGARPASKPPTATPAPVAPPAVSVTPPAAVAVTASATPAPVSEPSKVAPSVPAPAAVTAPPPAPTSAEAPHKAAVKPEMPAKAGGAEAAAPAAHAGGGSGSRGRRGPESESSRQREPREQPKEVKPPVPIKRIGTTVKGSAVVGQMSPEMIAAIKRNQAGAAGGRSSAGGGASASSGSDSDRRPRGGRGGPPERSDRERPGAGGGHGGPGQGAGGRPGGRGPTRVEVMPADIDLTSGKPAVKRVKAKPRPNQEADDREVQEKKAKLSRRSKSTRQEDWGIDEDGSGDYEVSDEAASGEGGPGNIDSTLIAADGEEDRGAGFKHKRADFKSKRMQHELPASFAEIDNEFTRSIASGGRRRSGRNTQRRSAGRRSRTRRIAAPIPRAAGQEAMVRLGMTLRDLSVAMGVKLQEMLAFLLTKGEMTQVNDIVTEETINQLAERFSIPLKWESDEDLEQELAEEAQHQDEESGEEETEERPPVVTFMGHVDHGKTSLLDAIRNTRVVAGEHGGITQHIGAYSVLRNGKRVSFLDTPGHEAFSAMRARGANLTDIAVLVVAADDGVMPQTEEAAAHAKNAGVPIVVAINKCDLPSANPDRVRQELANRLGLLPEEWGGQVGMVEVSAHTKKGINELVERILLEAEVLELKANPLRPATGFVVEAKMAEGQGVVATLLVSDGTLHVGDVILCSNGYGKIRFMYDEFGQPIKDAGPGMPVRMSGLSAVPEAGDKFFILSDILKARAIAEQREREARAAAMAKRQHVTLENLTSHLAGSGARDLRVIVKADVVGSLEVIDKTLRDMATSEVSINIIHSAIGGVNHADVILADASDAIILGFHVGVESQARLAAASLGVQIKTYHIIYRMMEDMKAALEGLLPPEEKEVVQGHVEIRQVFRSSKVGAIAGCYVTDGVIHRSDRIRLYRNQVVVYDGTIQSLRRVKDDAREVKSGFECGIKIANYDGVEEGDMIEAYSIEEIARKLS